MPGSLVIKNGVRTKFPYNVKYSGGNDLLSITTNLASQRRFRIILEMAGDPLSRAILSEGPHINYPVLGTLKLLTLSDLVFENVPKVTVNMDEGVFIFYITSENKDIKDYIKKAWKLLGTNRTPELLGYDENMLNKDFISLSKDDEEEGGHFIIENSDAVDFNWITDQINFSRNMYGNLTYTFFFRDFYDEDSWKLYASGSCRRFAEILKNIFNDIKFSRMSYLFLNDDNVLTPELLKEDEDKGKFTSLTDLFLEKEKLLICMGSKLYKGFDVYGKEPQDIVMPIYDNHLETLLKEIWYLIYYFENIHTDYMKR